MVVAVYLLVLAAVYYFVLVVLLPVHFPVAAAALVLAAVVAFYLLVLAGVYYFVLVLSDLLPLVPVVSFCLIAN